MPNNRTAFFVGIPTHQEQDLLNLVRLTHQVYTINTPTQVYDSMAKVVPDMIMFSSTRADTATLTLFRQLRRVGGMKMVVCEDNCLQVFSGRRHHGRYSIPKSSDELSSVLA